MRIRREAYSSQGLSVYIFSSSFPSSQTGLNDAYPGDQSKTPNCTMIVWGAWIIVGFMGSILELLLNH